MSATRYHLTRDDGSTVEQVTLLADQWERIAAVVREAIAISHHMWWPVVDALTPDDIEAVQP